MAAGLVLLVMNIAIVATGPWTYVGHGAKTALALIELFVLVRLGRTRLSAVGDRP